MMGFQPISGTTLMDYLVIAAQQAPNPAMTGLWAKWRRIWRKLIHKLSNVTVTMVWLGELVDNPDDVLNPGSSPPVTNTVKAYSEGVSDSQVQNNRSLRMSDANVFISSLDITRKPEVGASVSLGTEVHTVIECEQWPRGGPIVVFYVLVCRTHG
jgi:hypothetical protein